MKNQTLKMVGRGQRWHLPLIGGALMSYCLVAWPLDLMQAYQAAQRNDATLRASRANAEAGRERLPQAESQLKPSVAINASHFTNELTASNVATGVDSPLQRYESNSANITVRQPLIRTSLIAQVRQAAAQVDDVNAGLRRDEQNLAIRLVGAYLDALGTGDQLALVVAQRVFYTAQLDSARKTFAAGAGTRTDVDEVQARLDMVQAMELEARQNVGYAKRQLQVLVGESVETLAPLNVSKLELALPQPDSVDNWIERAEQNSPEMRMARAQLDAAVQGIDRAKAGHHPTLDGVVQWSRSDRDNTSQPNTRTTNASLGVQLTIPLFSGGYVDSSIRQALAERDRAQEALESLRLDLGVRVHKEFRGISEGILKIRALEQAVRSADQVVLSNQKSFVAGSRTVVDILNAEQQRTVALRDLAQARHLYLLSRVKLLALVDAADAQAMTELNSSFGN
ncbi:MAG: hypothetical protein RLZ81_296 [Pseudomonadota bacterium]